MQEFIIPHDTTIIENKGPEYCLTLVFRDNYLVMTSGNCNIFFKTSLIINTGINFDNIDWHNVINKPPILMQGTQCCFSFDGDLLLISSAASNKYHVLTFSNLSKICHDKIEFYKDTSPTNYLIMKSPKMEQIANIIKQIALVDSTVLLLGESGVGKSIITKLIHKESNRHDKPFVSINCGALPEHLIETELFGYEPGTFTGGKKSGKAGLFEIADGGIIVLDEIAELPMILQVKLLEVLQENTIRKVGGTIAKRIDVRVIASTNKDLVNLTKQKLFREDLFYRINVVPITIPPLRERTEDIPELITHFLYKYNSKYGLNKKLSPEIKAKLMNYSWPGNVRELENTIERIVVTNSENVAENLFLDNETESEENAKVNVSGIIPLKTAKHIVEKILVTRAYNLSGSTYKAAKILKINQSTVVKILKKYTITKPK